MHLDELPPYPHAEQVARATEAAAAAAVSDSGWRRENYLDLAEPIVRTAIKWQDDEGFIIDPAIDEESVTCTARFVGALAILIGAGRCTEHVEACARAMDTATEQIAIPYGQPGHARAADFNTRDLMMAVRFVSPHVDADRAAEWRRRLATVDPDDLYDCGANTPPNVTHNWVVYAVVGEYLKTVDGLTDTSGWVERMIGQQLPLFTADGWYKDPNCPITYDLTVRQGFSWMLHNGYDGPNRDLIDEILRRGALTTLLTASPTGEAAFGGRSNQYHFMEAMTACFCESEAKRYAASGDRTLAGAFKRQAHLSAQAVRAWVLETKPWRHIKNRFPPTSLHGCDPYGHLSVYGLLAANLFGVAYLMADDDIAEGPTFSEAGSRVVAVDPGFHKVYATCRRTHLQIDTSADHHYEATGLGRFHRAGVPTFLGLSASCTGKPTYTVTIPTFTRSVAIGPGWCVDGHWWYLADLGEEVRDVELRVEREGDREVAFRIVYQLEGVGADQVVERCRLAEGRVDVNVAIGGEPDSACLSVPLWMTDGELETLPDVLDDGFRVRLGDHEYRVRWTGNADPETTTEPGAAANRNGAYLVGRIEVESNELSYALELS
jgi:hypothetical protein